MERAEMQQRRLPLNQDNKRDILVSAEEEKNMNTSGIGGVGYVAFTVNRSITHIVRVRTPKPTPDRKSVV